MDRTVVITGMGAVTPIGNDVETMWESIKSSKCGISKLTKFDATEYGAQIAGEVKDFDPTKRLDAKEIRSAANCTVFALYAAAEAIEEAKLMPSVTSDNNIAVYIGNGIGGFEVTENNLEKLFARGPRAISPLTIPLLIANEVPAAISIKYGFNGPCMTITTACSSGTDAIGHAFKAIKSGLCDIVIAGGAEAAITKLSVAGFCRLHALTMSHNDSPEKACSPFDLNRDGFTIGEGAGVLVLETKESALKRGAKILGEISGYGASCDAFHLTSPEPSGKGAVLAFERALMDAGLTYKDVDYINAHGTSTHANDVMETNAIKQIFKERAKEVKISSTKGMTSHLIGAAGAVEAIICLKALKEGFYPPTINYTTPDPECDLDYIPNQGIKKEMKVALSDSLGFGGHNGVLVFKRSEE